MVYFFLYWMYLGKEGKIIFVVIYINCDVVELFINNVFLGSKFYIGE